MWTRRNNVKESILVIVVDQSTPEILPIELSTGNASQSTCSKI
jgi:hypothetical protein